MIDALLDASVLIPSPLADTLLRAAESEIYRLAWSDEILAEVERNLVQDRLTTADGALRRITTMRRAFPTATVHDYHQLVERMPNNPKDRHVLAAAVAAKIGIIVTSNLRHFPPHDLIPYGIEAMSPDAFLLQLDDVDDIFMTRIIREQSADLRFPPMTAHDVLTNLSLHVPRFAARMFARLESD